MHALRSHLGHWPLLLNIYFGFFQYFIYTMFYCFCLCKTLANEISGNSSLQIPTLTLLAGGGGVASAAASARLKSLGERGIT